MDVLDRIEMKTLKRNPTLFLQTTDFEIRNGFLDICFHQIKLTLLLLVMDEPWPKTINFSLGDK